MNKDIVFNILDWQSYHNEEEDDESEDMNNDTNIENRNVNRYNRNMYESCKPG